MNFQVLSISFQTLKSGYFIFANNGYVSNEKKKKNESKRKHRVPEFFPKQEEKDHSTI